MPITISLTAGRPALDHNRRTFTASNVDPERSKDNIVLADESLEAAYAAVFGDSIEAANKTQIRKDRLLTPEKYLAKIKKGQDKETNPKPCYEMIVQVGDMDTTGFEANPAMAAKAKEVLKDFAKQLQEDTRGHMHIMGAYIHMDEATPHIHIDYIPLAHGYKKGMPTRNALGKALQEMGYQTQNKKVNSITAWQYDLRDSLVQICRSHGIEASWSKHDIAEEHLTVGQHKKLMRIAERKMNQALEAYHETGFIDRLTGKADQQIKEAYKAHVLAAEAEKAQNKKLRQVLNDRIAAVDDQIEELDSRSAAIEVREKALDQEIADRKADQNRAEQEQHERLDAEEKAHQAKIARENAELTDRMNQVRQLAEQSDADKKASEEKARKAANDLQAAQNKYDAAMLYLKQCDDQKEKNERMAMALYDDQQKFARERVSWKSIEDANTIMANAVTEKNVWMQKYNEAAMTAQKYQKESEVNGQKVNTLSQELAGLKARLESQKQSYEAKFASALQDAEKRISDAVDAAQKKAGEQISVLKTTITEKEERISAVMADRDKAEERADMATAATNEKAERLAEARNTITKQDYYITALRTQVCVQDSILNGRNFRDLRFEAEVNRKAYAFMANDARKKCGLDTDFKRLLPSDQQKDAARQIMKREWEKKRNHSQSREY